MLLLGAEIGLLIFGIYALVRGRLKVTNNRIVRGVAARLLGIVAMLPVPLALLIGFVMGMEAAARGRPMDDAFKLSLTLIELGLVAGCGLFVFTVGFFLGGSSEEERASRSSYAVPRRKRPLPADFDEVLPEDEEVVDAEPVQEAITSAPGIPARKPRIAPRRIPAREEEEADEPESSSVPLIVGVVAGGLLLFGLGIAAVLIFSGSEEPGNVAQHNRPGVVPENNLPKPGEKPFLPRERKDRVPIGEPPLPPLDPEAKAPIPQDVLARYQAFQRLPVRKFDNSADHKQPEQGPLSSRSELWNALRKQAEARRWRKEPAYRGAVGRLPIEDIPTEGRLLIGFHCTKGQYITSIQPIYLTAKGEQMGPRVGSEFGAVTTLKAAPGYAVGAINVRAGDVFDAVTLVFMKVTDKELDTRDAYRSEEFDCSGGGDPFTTGGDGSFLVGLHSRTLAQEYFVPRGSPTTLGVISWKR